MWTQTRFSNEKKVLQKSWKQFLEKKQHELEKEENKNLNLMDIAIYETTNFIQERNTIEENGNTARTITTEQTTSTTKIQSR